MKGFERPWFVAGGWAIDLYLGQVSRPHADIEIGIFRSDQLGLQKYLAGWEFQKVIHKVGLEGWEIGEYLELPTHEAYARRDKGQPTELEILLDESDGQDWKFRKNLAITRPLDLALIRAENGVLFLAPEIALLYKAATSTPREKDWLDFQQVIPVLEAERKEWLKQSLAKQYPGHLWLEKNLIKIATQGLSRPVGLRRNEKSLTRFLIEISPGTTWVAKPPLGMTHLSGY